MPKPLPRESLSLFVLASFCLALAAGPLAPAFAAFTDGTAAYGIWCAPRMSYAGGFADIDGDGDDDLYASNHWEDPSQLYVNLEGYYLWELPGFYDLGMLDRHDQLWGDFDNDGAPDQYVIHGHDQPNELFWNHGNNIFSEGALAAGADDENGRGREITLADFNLDGKLDIFVANAYRLGYANPSVMLLNVGGAFIRAPNFADPFRARIHCASTDYDLDGLPDLLTTSPYYVAGELYRNNGDFTWTDVVATAFPGITAPLEQAQGISWADYDDDGDPDLLACGGNRGMWDFAALEGDSLRTLILCDSTETKSLEIATDGDSVTVFAQRSTYTQLICYYGAGGDTVSAYPVSFALSDLAGVPPQAGENRLALLLWSTDGGAVDTLHLAVQAAYGSDLIVGASVRANGSGLLSFEKTDFTNPPGYAFADWTNRLYRNEGDGTFSEVTGTAFAVNPSDANGMGAAWADYDNDGWVDVYVTNGGTIETGNQPNYLYRNNGDGTFSEVAAAEGVAGSTLGLGDGAAWGDVNDDGFLDLFVDNGAEYPPYGIGPRELWLNTPNANHWIKLQFVGMASNGSGIGARVKMVCGSKTIWRTHLGESDNCFGSYLGVHAGLGPDDMIDPLEVHWPSGQVDVYTRVQADHNYVAIEGEDLRYMDTPVFDIFVREIVDTLDSGGVHEYIVPIGNDGGAGANYILSVQECVGGVPTWLTVDPLEGALWPGKQDSLSIYVDATDLPAGDYCGNVVIYSNGLPAADKVSVDIHVTGSLVGVTPGPAGTTRFDLGPPRPHPARTGTDLLLSLPAPAVVAVEIVDIRGRVLRTLADRAFPAGSHRLRWDRRDDSGQRVAAGVYFARAGRGGEVRTRKIVVVD